MEDYRRIYWPAINLIGVGAIQGVVTELQNLQLTNVLVVTDKVLRAMGVTQKVTDLLAAAGIAFTIYDDVKPNPTVANVNNGLAVYQAQGCKGIVSIGGGSPQDAAKAIGLLQTNGGNIVDYEGIGKSINKSVPIVAINTTAGTASEVTINYVITDEVRKIKMVMVDPNCLASVSVNDPELMLGKPAGLTAATGMDALTHALEAFITKGAFRLSDTLALEAIKLIGESLADAVADGSNLTARTKMAWASYIAGLAFSNCGLGIVHSMAHQLGSEYDLPHGVANALLLPYVASFNLSACPEKFAQIASALGKNTIGLNTADAAQLAIDALREMAKALQIPTLKDTRFQLSDIDKLAEQAMRDVCTGGNPRTVSVDDIKQIFINAYQG